MTNHAERTRRRQQSARDRAKHQRQESEKQQILREVLRQIQAPQMTTRLSLFPQLNSVELSPATKTPSSSTASCSRICSRLSQLLNNPILSDVEITVGLATIPAHRIVLCLQSEYFARALTGGFDESSSQKLQCPTGSEQAYMRVLSYLYRGDYDETGSGDVSNDDDPVPFKHLKVYFLADMYCLDGLKSLACSKFRAILKELESSDEFVGCVRAIYSETSSEHDELRAIISENAALRHEKLLSNSAFQGLVKEGGDFALDVVRALTPKRPETLWE